MRVPPTDSTGLDHTNSDRPSSPPLPLSIRYPLRWIFIPLLAGFNLGQSVGADFDGATSAAPSGLSTRVTVLATGKGFVRLSYEATLTDTDSTESLVERMAPRHWLAASMVGLPRGVQPSLHVLEARPSSRRSSEVDSDLLLDGPVQLGAPVQLRDQYAVPVRFAPRREGDGRIVVYDRVVVDVIFDDPGRVSGWPERDEHFEPIYTSLLINESQARRWRRRPPRPASKLAQDGIHPLTGMIKVHVREEGMYRVTADELRAAGADLTDVDPARIRVLSSGGRILGRTDAVAPGHRLHEQSSLVEGGAGGTFRGDDALMFYGVGPARWDWDPAEGDYFWRENLYTHDNIYWIDLHAPAEAARPQQLDGSVGRAPSAIVDFHRHRRHDERERTILLQIFQLHSGYEWFWESFNRNASNFSFDLPHVVEGATVDLRVGFWGWTDEVHTFEINWNGERVGVATFLGEDHREFSFQAEQGPLEGFNQVGVFHRRRGLTRLDWLEIEFLQQLDASDGVLAFNWADAADGGAVIDSTTGAVTQFELHGFDPAHGAPRVFRVSGDLQELADFDYEPASGTVRFQDWFDGRGQPPRYLALQTPMQQEVISFIIDTQQPLLETTVGADNLLITHEDFADAAKRLADWRNEDRRFGDPITTKVVDVQDIYDAFSGGLVDPMAIRSFVHHAYNHWEPRPSFVTLFGDGTYDYKDNGGTGHPNWIPAYQAGESTFDEWYVRIEGEDRTPELAIGRLPVTSLDEAHGLVDKIIAYDRLDSPGPWQSRVLLVADDLVDPSNIHEPETYFLHDAERMPLPENLDLTKLYIANFPIQGRIKPKARDEFIRLFNEGSVLLTYLGHGNPETLAHEQIFVVSRDLPSIDNSGRLPFMYTAASQIGVFDDPDRQSMPEVLLNEPHRGVIGFICATRIGFHSSNALLALKFHESMFRTNRDGLPVGLGLLEAKAIAHALVVKDVHRTNVARYSLIGDPTLRLAVPRVGIVIELPDTLEALQEATLHGRVVDANNELRVDYDGQALVRVFDSAVLSDLDGLLYVQQGSVIFRGHVDVVDGRFSATLRVPKDISYRAADGRASAYAVRTDGTQNATGLATAPAFGARSKILLEGTARDIDPDVDGPQIRIGFQGQTTFRDGDFVAPQPVLRAILSDPSGINVTGGTGHEIELIVDEERMVVTDHYNSLAGDYRRGLLEVELPVLEPGDHTLSLRAWDSFNNSTRVGVTIRVPASTQQGLSDLLFYPNPSPDGKGHFTYVLSSPATSSRLRIYALSGRLIDTVGGGTGPGYHQMNWTPPTRLAGGTYLYRLEVDLVDGSRSTAQGHLQVVPGP